MTDRTEAVRQQRSLSSTHKFERVVPVTRALLERGDEPAMAEIARHAEVSRNFFYKPECVARLPPRCSRRRPAVGSADSLQPYDRRIAARRA